jgi:hypothetical protein
VDSLIQFLERYEIPLNAFSRRTTISAWAIRQARAGVRSLSITQENAIKVTVERIKAGRLWLRRKNRQRWDLEWVVPSWKIRLGDGLEPPLRYEPRCPMNALYCGGGLLPGSCPKNWRECGFVSKDWEAVEKIHQSYAEQ